MAVLGLTVRPRTAIICHMQNYITEATEALREAVRRQGKDPDKSLTPALQQGYTLLVLTKGELTTLSDVHDAWGVARAVEQPNHPDLVPFEVLAGEVQAYDKPFLAAIHDAAREVDELR